MAEAPYGGTPEVTAYEEGMVRSGMQVRAVGMQEQVLLGELDALQKVWTTQEWPQRSTA